MPERPVKHNVTHFGWVGAGYISGLNPVSGVVVDIQDPHAFFSIILNPLTPSHCGPIKFLLSLSFHATPLSVYNMTCPQCPSLFHNFFG